MRVAMIAKTYLTREGRQLLDQYENEDGSSDYAADPDRLAEIAGRLCYRSFHRPNPSTARNGDYLANVLGQGHESVVSHAGVSFLIDDVSRALTHELIRHRWLSFSQESQRYVAFRRVRSLTRLLRRRDELEVQPVYPPAADARERRRIRRTMRRGLAAYDRAVKQHERAGLTRKQAREAARAHLPNACPTALVVSGNLRAWRDLLAQRCSPHADAEIRAVALEVLDQLADYAPATFADLYEQFLLCDEPGPAERLDAVIESINARKAA